MLHTHTAKLAGWPAFTCLTDEKDWTRTQSCGVFFRGGGGVVWEGVGVGVGLDELGLGVGLVEFEPLEDRWVGDGLGLLRDELGVGNGVELGDFVVLGDLVGLGDLLRLGAFVGVADLVELADCVRLGDRLEGTIVSAARFAVLGTDEQALVTIGWLPTCAASASEAVLAVRNAIPATAPSAVDLRICALTSATSLTLVGWPDRSPSLAFSHYASRAMGPHRHTPSLSRVHEGVTAVGPGELRSAS